MHSHGVSERRCWLEGRWSLVLFLFPFDVLHTGTHVGSLAGGLILLASNTYYYIAILGLVRRLEVLRLAPGSLPVSFHDDMRVIR